MRNFLFMFFFNFGSAVASFETQFGFLEKAAVDLTVANMVDFHHVVMFSLVLIFLLTIELMWNIFD